MEFDINTLRSIVTVVSFAVFIGIVWWAWSKRRSKDTKTNPLSKLDFGSLGQLLG